MLNIKIEKEDLEKQANNFRSKLIKAFVIFVLGNSFLLSQDSYRKGGTYTIDTVTVVGLQNFSDRTVVTYSGLRKGQSLQVPGEEVSSILKKLWNLELFSDVNLCLIYTTEAADDIQ